MILAGAYFLYIGGDFLEFLEQHLLSGFFPILIIIIYIVALIVRIKIIKDQRALLKYEREQRILNEKGGRELSVEEKEIQRAMKEKQEEIEKETLEESLRQLDNEIAVKKREDDDKKLLEGRKELGYVEEPEEIDDPLQKQPIEEVEEPDIMGDERQDEREDISENEHEDDSDNEEEPEIDEEELLRRRREVFIKKMREAARQRKDLEESGELDAKPYDPFDYKEEE